MEGIKDWVLTTQTYASAKANLDIGTQMVSKIAAQMAKNMDDMIMSSMLSKFKKNGIKTPPKFIFRGSNQNQPLGASDGQIVYNEDDNNIYVFHSNGWHKILTNRLQGYENTPIKTTKNQITKTSFKVKSLSEVRGFI